MLPRNHPDRIQIAFDVRAIAYEITTPSLRRKPESIRLSHERTGSVINEFAHWIPAFAGMTGIKLPICDSPAFDVTVHV